MRRIPAYTASEEIPMHPSPRHRILLALTAGCALALWALAHGCAQGNVGIDPPFGTGGSGNGTATGGGGTTVTGGGGVGGEVGGAGGGGGGGGGSSPECSQPEDCPGVDLTCSFRSCEASQCGLASAPESTTCAYNGGQVCDGQGNCVECVQGSDCPQGVCQSGQCAPSSCLDSVENGDETDVDCGGSCAPCANGLDCLTEDDCISGVCTAGTCGPCLNDGACPLDHYCDGGGACQPKKILGDVCTASGQCLSDFCSPQDGLCCDGACNLACEACLFAKTGSANGTCDAVTANTDPDGECTDQGVPTCGIDGTGCNGDDNAPACKLYPAGAECVPSGCANGQETEARLCDGQGICLSSATTPCDPYVCDGNGDVCLATCSSDNDCIGGFECDSNNDCTVICSGNTVKCNGVCIDPLTDLVYCGADAQCQNYQTCSGNDICDNGSCGPPAVDPQCFQPYNTLDLANRNVSFNDGDGGVEYCDSTNGPGPQWQGAGWYRFQGGAGSQMLESAPAIYACGTDAPGWLNGSHPQPADGIVARTVCFHWSGNTCYWSTSVDVVNCQTYYLYSLPVTPACDLRYCGQ